MRIIYLQLPRLDNAARGRTENVPLAGVYLQQALRRAGLSAQAQFITEEWSDAALLELIAAQRPDAIAATLYLWNIERTLHVLRRVRAILPAVKIFGGGPEVAKDHPFLFRARVFDALVEGEGEAVFPELLRGRMNFMNVARRAGSRYGWGAQPAPAATLAQMLPPANDARLQPDAHGMAYLETGRGCPLHCAYCRYPSLRTRMSFLSATEALARVRVLRRRGAKEIRFIDPTLNANPQFDALLRGLVRLNRRGGLKFFGELQAERLSADQIALLPRAGFTEIEAGVQSRDPLVLRAVHRPERLAPLERNIAALARAGVRVTIDLMYGLPHQRVGEVRSSLRWAWKQPHAYVQCLQTLLLPGTELRARRRKLGLCADARPPYGVRATPTMSSADIHALEATVYRKEAPDCPTRRFVGENLPDLFRERNTVEVHCDKIDRRSLGRAQKVSPRSSPSAAYGTARAVAIRAGAARGRTTRSARCIDRGNSTPRYAMAGSPRHRRCERQAGLAPRVHPPAPQQPLSPQLDHRGRRSVVRRVLLTAILSSRFPRIGDPQPRFFQGLEKARPAHSRPWKEPRKIFQEL
ncbi:MAG: radical SAM protein [Kiritimatiellaeota bacterium]|nr:radical SAM protein [Kiritimatiellota bacterium]